MSLAHSCLAPSRASMALQKVRRAPSGVRNPEVANPNDVLPTGLINLAHIEMSSFLRAVLLWARRSTLIVRTLKWAAFFARLWRNDKRPSRERGGLTHAE